MNNKLIKGVLLIGLVLIVPLQAQARGFSMFAGVGMGYGIIDEVSPNTDEANIASKLYLGAMIMGPLGVEVGFYKPGTFNSGDDKTSGTGITAIGKMMAKNAMLFAKAGIINWGVTDVPNNIEITGSDIMYGFGIELPLTKQVMFRTEMEVLSNVGKYDAAALPGQDITLLSFGVNITF